MIIKPCALFVSFHQCSMGQMRKTKTLFHLQCFWNRGYDELALVHCKIYIDVSVVIVSPGIKHLRRHNHNAFATWNAVALLYVCHCFVCPAMQISIRMLIVVRTIYMGAKELNWICIICMANVTKWQSAITISIICLVFTSITHAYKWWARFIRGASGSNETHCCGDEHSPVHMCTDLVSVHKVVAHHSIANTKLLMMLKKLKFVFFFHDNQTHAINIVILMNNEKVWWVRTRDVQKTAMLLLFFQGQ